MRGLPAFLCAKLFFSPVKNRQVFLTLHFIIGVSPVMLN